MFGEIDDVIIELDPAVILRLYIHRQVIIQKMKRKRNDPARFLVFQVCRSRFTESRQQGVSGQYAWNLIVNMFGQLKRFRSRIGIQPQDESDLEVRNIFLDHIQLGGDFLKLFRAR